MRRFLLASGLTILVMLFVAACSDKGAPAAPGGGGTLPPVSGSGGTGGSGGDAGQGGAGGHAGQGGAGGDAGRGGSGGVGVLGACESDFEILATLQPDNARTLAASIAVDTCFFAVTSEPLYINCMVGEMQRSLPGLSEECATCYGELAWCSIPRCNRPCSDDSCSIGGAAGAGGAGGAFGCFDCPGYDACLDDLRDCTGRTPPECSET